MVFLIYNTPTYIIILVYSIILCFNFFDYRTVSLPVCQEPLSRVALHGHSHQPHSPDPGQEARQSTAHNFCSSLLASTLHAHQKLTSFESLWPDVMKSLVEKVLREYENIDQEMQTMLEQL